VALQKSLWKSLVRMERITGSSMLNEVVTFLKPPLFPEDEDKTRKAKYANAIAIVFFVVIIVYQISIRLFQHYTAFSAIDLIMFGIALICVWGFVLLRKGLIRFTSFLLVVGTCIASNSIAASGFGIKDASYILNFSIVLMAGLLLGWQAALLITGIGIVSGFGLAYAESTGLITVNPYPVTSSALDMAFTFVINGALIYLLIDGLETALKRSRANFDELEVSNLNLNVTQNELKNRSEELSIAVQQLESSTKKLRTVAEVTSTAASLRDFDILLSLTTSVISDQLGYYHVAIFLLDQQKEFAILRSANTEGGLRMLQRGFKVPIGQLGIVSSVAQSAQPRIANNRGEHKFFFTNPDLSKTQSELALPLKSRDEVIGVLDIQSTNLDEFSADDVSILSILADQVAIALQNALLFDESQRALREAKIESLQASRKAWKDYGDVVQTKGYRYDGIKSEPLKDTQLSNGESIPLSIPVQLRGQTIGRLKLSAADPSRQWTDDELLMVSATAERVALALEGARLLDEAQKRATREAFLSEIAAKLSTSFQLDSILRDTVQELGQTLKNSTVTFQLVNPSVPPAMSEPERSNGTQAE
jgi:GAF domain-containing protein